MIATGVAQDEVKDGQRLPGLLFGRQVAECIPYGIVAATAEAKQWTQFGKIAAGLVCRPCWDSGIGKRRN